jgi:hypothetical protein
MMFNGNVSLNRPNHTEITVGDIIRIALPGGTHTELEFAAKRASPDMIDKVVIERALRLRGASSDRRWAAAPPLPPDVFGVMGLLLDLSGATHHICQAKRDGWVAPLEYSEADLKSATLVGEAWRVRELIPLRKKGRFSLSVPDKIAKHWAQLWEHRNEPLFKRLRAGEPHPAWWKDSLFLFVAADEAAFGFGFPVTQGTVVEPMPAAFWDMRKLFNMILIVENTPGSRSVKAKDTYESISTIPRDIACVLPKARTPQTGSTLRNLSHHLALLPARGLARAYWHMPPPVYDARSESDPLNLLLVPYPYVILPSNFAPKLPDERMDGRWGWFDVDGHWHASADPEEVVSFIHDLVATAQRISGPIHGIVLPECAVDFSTYTLLRPRVNDSIRMHGALREIDFLVAGVNKDEDNKACNMAATTVFYRTTKPVPGDDVPFGSIRNTQYKHHRWRIDHNQIRQYGLGSALSLGRTWWEGIELSSRKLNVFVFRRGATLAPLICEDLARLEPVHELIRSIGPNLVIALLLDGAQIASRWPGRYAMGLADDPGSSVLTLTSYGLVARSGGRVGVKDGASRSIGLWRDDQGDTKELLLAKGSAAVMLSLSGERHEEFTSYGRSDSRFAVRWKYADQMPIPFPQGSKFAPED